MSHFSVSVIVPHDYSNSHVTANDIDSCLHRILAPYDEQTEETEYREFEDRTDEAKADYETDTMRVIRYPDGTVRSIYDRIFTDKFYIHEDMIYQYGAEKSKADQLQTEESKALELVNDYPVKAWYASFEAYVKSIVASFRIVKDCGATPIIPTPSGTGGRSAAASPETSW